MHTVAAFFASIIAVVTSVFASPTVAPNAPVDIRAVQPAAAAATQIATTSNPFLDPSAPPVLVPPPSSPPPQTVINQPVIERIIERVVPQGGSSISAEKLTAILKEFGQSIESRIAAVASAPIAFSGPAPTTPISTATFAPSQRIDQLTNTAINTSTITGGSISGATVSGTLTGNFSGTVSSLTMSSIPWGLIATDGSGNFLATSTPTAAAYIATSTTATSTFAGGLTAANGNFSILQNGYVGIGTTTPGSLLSLSNIANFTTATSTFYSTGGMNLAAGCFAKGGSCLSFADLTGTLGIAQGGTGTTTQVTNGISYFDGTKITSGTALTFNGTNFGIGTTTPSANLVVNGTTGQNLLQVATSTNQRIFTITQNGKVGIGTAAPAGLLNISGSDSQTTAGASSVGLLITNSSNSGGAMTDLQFGGSAGGLGAAISYRHTSGSNNTQGDLTFSTRVNTTDANLTRQMTILAGGNVGVGTTTPGSLLSLSNIANFAALGTTFYSPVTIPFTQTGAGAVARTVDAKLKESVSVLDFAADPTGAADSTTAFQNAIATGKTVYVPTGTYKVIDMITLQSGQQMRGDGMSKSTISVDAASFNMSALGVVRFANNSASVGLFDIAISFVQPDVSSRASVNQYPPAIYAVNATRFNIDRVRISSAWDGINATGNTGGSFVGDLDIGALNKGITMDGALDFVNIEALECWPFGMSATTNLYPSVYSDGSTVCAELGQVDGLSIGSIDLFLTKLVFAGTSSGIPARISRVGLDVTASMEFSSAQAVMIGQIYSTKGATDPPTATVSNGRISINDFEGFSSSTNGDFVVTGGELRLNGGRFTYGHLSTPVVSVSGAGKAYVRNVVFVDQNTGARSVSPIVQTGASSTIVATGNSFIPSTIPGGVPIFSIGSDNASNYIDSNNYNGWAPGFPTTRVGYYGLLYNDRLGLGTTTPASKLWVAGTSTASRDFANGDSMDAALVLQSTAGGVNTGGQLLFGSQYGTMAGIKGILLNGTGPAGALAFQTRNLVGDIVERMTINYTGNVGIGTTSPMDILTLNSSGTGGEGLTIANFKPQLTLYDLSGSGEKMHINYDGNAAGGGVMKVDKDGTDLLTLTEAGNVGIGTTTPSANLVVNGTTGQNLLQVATSTNQGVLVVTQHGHVGIGTVNPFGLLNVSGSDSQTTAGASSVGLRITNRANGAGAMTDLQFGGTSAGLGAAISYRHTSGSNNTQGDLTFSTRVNTTDANLTRQMTILAGGDVGIGTTTPTAQLSTTGTVRFAGLGSAGANLVTDALGNVTASSDERLKDKQGDFTRGLTAINTISPVLYKWRPETGFDTQSTYAGFFAQNVQAAIPEAVSQDARGHLTLADRPILAALVNATKEIGTIAGAFNDALTAWLGSASNGIGDLFAKDIYATNGTFDTTSTRKLCITDGANDNAPLCLTKSQLAALLGQTGAAAAPASVIPQAPVIELNGNASSTLNIGDTYNDLGARIVAPTSDLNLGITILLDGATTTQVTIDTTTPGEHTILYTVTSPTTGLTGSAMRTVTITAAEPLPMPVVEDNPFTSQPANDNVSTTSLLFAEPVAFSL
jgi:hypothetical protein